MDAFFKAKKLSEPPPERAGMIYRIYGLKKIEYNCCRSFSATGFDVGCNVVKNVVC